MKNIHATAVEIDKNGILIIGASGSGKSDLALRLIENKGATLVADDRVDLDVEGDKLFGICPKALESLLEVRGIGVIKKPFTVKVQIKLVVTAAEKQEIERMPENTFFNQDGVKVECVLLDLLEPSAPDKVVVKLKAVLEQDL